jgi:hypothetical protein
MTDLSDSLKALSLAQDGHDVRRCARRVHRCLEELEQDGGEAIDLCAPLFVDIVGGLHVATVPTWMRADVEQLLDQATQLASRLLGLCSMLTDQQLDSLIDVLANQLQDKPSPELLQTIVCHLEESNTTRLLLSPPESWHLLHLVGNKCFADLTKGAQDTTTLLLLWMVHLLRHALQQQQQHPLPAHEAASVEQVVLMLKAVATEWMEHCLDTEQIDDRSVTGLLDLVELLRMEQDWSLGRLFVSLVRRSSPANVSLLQRLRQMQSQPDAQAVEILFAMVLQQKGRWDGLPPPPHSETWKALLQYAPYLVPMAAGPLQGLSSSSPWQIWVQHATQSQPQE